MTRPIHPGRILRREIDARSWTQTYLAAQLDWSTSELHLLLSGGHRMNESRAADLARVFGNSPDFWLNLERQYRSELLRKINSSNANNRY
jgi:addiction module HigA family antidote